MLDEKTLKLGIELYREEKDRAKSNAREQYYNIDGKDVYYVELEQKVTYHRIKTISDEIVNIFLREQLGIHGIETIIEEVNRKCRNIPLKK